MEAQKIFDDVVIHLLTQGERATQKNECKYNICRYRTKEGLKCAIGGILPDELYDISMDEGFDSGGIDTLWENFPEVVEYFGDHNYDLLQELQYNHDIKHNWKTSETLKEKLKFTGKQFNLNTRILDTFTDYKPW